MTKEVVLQALIKLFTRVNAVDPNLDDSEIAQIKLPKLAWFRRDLGLDPDYKRHVLFRMMENALRNAHSNKINPVIFPQDKAVFRKKITIDELATQIARYTPKRII